MGILDRLRGRTAAPETRASVTYGPSYSLGNANGPVLPHQAENLSTVTACVNAIADGLGTLPARMYRTAGHDGRVELDNHPVARLIRAPSPHQTWPDWIAWTVAQMLLWGNSLSVIEYDGAGRPVALRPVPWPQVRVSLLPSGRMVYDVVAYMAPFGATGVPRRFLDSEAFHLKDRSDDGYVGRSRLSRAPSVLAAAIGVQDYSTAVWTNAATPSGILTVPSNVSTDGIRRMEAFFLDRMSGSQNAKRVFIADRDTTFTPMSVSPEDAEVLASRRFSVQEVCRLFNVPPPIVQDYTNNTFTNSGQASLWFASNTLAPIARKIEAEFARSVINDPTGATHMEIDLSGLMRGDFATRTAANVANVAAGILTIDEVREAEGYGPLGTTDDAPVPGAAA
jgi:HK97 family phage portal protein